MHHIWPRGPAVRRPRATRAGTAAAAPTGSRRRSAAPIGSRAAARRRARRRCLTCAAESNAPMMEVYAHVPSLLRPSAAAAGSGLGHSAAALELTSSPLSTMTVTMWTWKWKWTLNSTVKVLLRSLRVLAAALLVAMTPGVSPLNLVAFRQFAQIVFDPF